ncbi:MAG: ABC transporter ATP-binding protein [Candidatus Kapaibacterium sp.]
MIFTKIQTAPAFMTILTAENLHKSYSLNSEKDTTVLQHVSLQVERGEFLAVVGPSGAGKSTLLHILGTLDKPDTGRVEFTWEDKKYPYNSMSSKDLEELRNKHIGFIFQFHHLLPEFTALENVMMPALIARESMKSAATKAKELMDIVGMSHRTEHKPSELSGGEQQRIAIARALINKPSVLLADEPTGNLDSVNTDAILNLLHTIRTSRSLTMIIATHSTDVASAAQRVITMRDGRIV